MLCPLLGGVSGREKLIEGLGQRHVLAPALVHDLNMTRAIKARGQSLAFAVADTAAHADCREPQRDAAKTGRVIITFAVAAILIAMQKARYVIG